MAVCLRFVVIVILRCLSLTPGCLKTSFPPTSCRWKPKFELEKVFQPLHPQPAGGRLRVERTCSYETFFSNFCFHRHEVGGKLVFGQSGKILLQVSWGYKPQSRACGMSLRDYIELFISIFLCANLVRPQSLILMFLNSLSRENPVGVQALAC